MNLISRFTGWYFSRRALPYWGILLLDCLVVLVSGYLAWYISLGATYLVEHIWPITIGLFLVEILFCLGFKCFHTYTGIVRYSTFIDLEHVVFADMVGAILTLVGRYALVALGVSCFLLPNLLGCVILFVLATFFMGMLRIAVKSLYDAFRINANTKKVFIYGVHAGGVSIAKSIQNQNPLQYQVVGFVTPDEELYSKYLMGALVRHDSPRLVGHMKEKGATILLVSPLQTEHFRTREDL